MPRLGYITISCFLCIFTTYIRQVKTLDTLIIWGVCQVKLLDSLDSPDQYFVKQKHLTGFGVRSCDIVKYFDIQTILQPN